MKIDQKYLSLLLKPLEDGNMPKVSDYVFELEGLGVSLEGEDGRIDPKFEVHLRHMCTNRIITNIDGDTGLKAIGFRLGAGGNIALMGHVRLMKREEEELFQVSNQINIGSIHSQQVQVGDGNTQNVTITLTELVEAVAKSEDEEAKSVLEKLLNNSTVGSLIGAGASILLGTLGA
jgi:sRNA-binding carbon storage regulator CsrA